MLDLLLAARANGADIDDEGIREEVNTIMFEVMCEFPKITDGFLTSLINFENLVLFFYYFENFDF